MLASLSQRIITYFLGKQSVQILVYRLSGVRMVFVENGHLREGDRHTFSGPIFQNKTLTWKHGYF